ncbi:alanyl-tRNA synthetase [Mobilisporobacter senegalensis]|uniref:Alanyl-tRNA synthetase n=1 Tax=Mobilisporobacter senegalensis TaxID=1329262 RepID=A0A3N1XRH2_9FIRM|nr:DHHA1 domain-containing protein [Mobilisporobacter senegalensis]ROR29269.1 alanyl-tRNA synthetase [Mobilisporobacter senegalensis]
MNTYENTKRLYYMDSHMAKFEGRVLDCIKKDGSYLVVLDQTAFFPEGGGQSSDKGEFKTASSSIAMEVIDVQEDNDIIYHTVTEPIEIGTAVTGYIDFDSRFQAMQHHSGEHIVSGLVHNEFGYDNVGFHMGSDAITMDFNGILKEEDIRKIEYLANEAVYKNVPIIETYPSTKELKELDYRSKKELTGQVRIVSIPDSIDRDGNISTSYYDVCACCAPHVYRTGEIGIIKLISYMKYKGGTRVSMLCGFKALEDYNKKESNVLSISSLLSAKPYEVADGVKRITDEVNSLRGIISGLQGQLLEYKAKEIPDSSKDICLFDNDIDSGNLRRYCNIIMERCSGIVIIFTGSDEAGYKYIIGSKTEDVRNIGKELNEAFGGRGGGSKDMVQGSVVGNQEDIKEFIMKKIDLSDD